MNFPFLRTGLEREFLQLFLSSLAGFLCKGTNRNVHKSLVKENFEENSCKTHLVCFNQLDFLAAPVKSKQGK